MRTAISTRFVQTVPDELQDGVLYVSMEYATVVHKCLCGCGKEVATPLSPTDWCLTFDGDTVSLDPSVGNWSFPCRSHYWIRNSQVLWCGDMPQSLIDAGRARDRRAKEAYYDSRSAKEVSLSQTHPNTISTEPGSSVGLRGHRSLWERLASWFS